MEVVRSIVFGLLTLLSASGHGQSVRAEGATVFVNEMPALTLRSSNGGLSPSQRALRVAENLLALGSRGLTVKKQGTSFAILSGDQPILFVTKQEGKAAKSDPAALARLWATRINQLAAMPALSLERNAVTMPVGEARSVALTGFEARKATVTSSNPEIILAEREGARVILRALARGNANVQVSGESGLQSISVAAMPFAARLPQTVDASVSGPLVDRDKLAMVVAGAVRTKMQTEPGTTFQMTMPKIESGLPAGVSRTFRVRVVADSPTAFKSEGYVDVVARNLALDFRREQELWYCNYPENVTSPGNLFGARLVNSKPARMLYHHINQSSAPMTIQVYVVNDSDTPAKVLLIPGDSTPDKNPVKAGYDAGDMFVRGWIRNSGEIVTIAPRSKLPISVRRCGPQDTMSGLAYLRLLEGGPESVLVRTDALATIPSDSRSVRALRSAAPWRELGVMAATLNDQNVPGLSTHIYPEPFRSPEPLNFTVSSDSVLFAAIGEKPIPSESGMSKLDGNFGVVYTIRANLANPSPNPASVEIFFEASAGYTGGLFMVNDRYVKTPLLQPKGVFELDRVRLAPGESRSVTIRTIPLSGASYPCRIWVANAGYSRSLQVGG